MIELTEIGWKELLYYPDLKFKLNSKIDSGAKISSIYGRNIKINNDYITFTFINKKNISIEKTFKIIKYLNIKSSNGLIEKRPCILLKVKFNKFITNDCLFSVTENRENMKFNILIGRESIPKDFVISVNKSYLLKKVI